MRPVRGRPLDQEARIELNAALGRRIELHHPALETIGIKLFVDGAIQRIGEIHAAAVAAYLDHLRSAVQVAASSLRVRFARYDAADSHCTRELRCERIGHVVLPQVAGTPAGDVEKTV